MATPESQVERLLKAMREADSQEQLQELEDEFTALISSLDHAYLGPTWQRDSEGRWLLPERTLGWAVIGWCSEYLQADDSSPDDIRPWKFTKEQVRFLLWWYAVDEHGAFVYRTGVLQRLKGWGKDPLLAIICLVEFVGPSRFSHFDEQGKPVGFPHPNAWVQIAAVSKEQTRNTFKVFPTIMSQRLIDEYKIDVAIEMMRCDGGRKVIECVTSSPKALEGGRATFVVLNETQWWIQGNAGHDMYEVIDGNVTKSKGGTARYLAICNAYVPGMDSVGERMRHGHELIQEGRAVDTKELYDSIEAHPATPLHPLALRIVIPIIRGDAWWLDPETIISSMQKTSLSISGSRRKWLNQIVAAEDQLYTEGNIDAIEVFEYLLPKSKVVLGFDGGKSDDSTALVAIRVADGCTFPLGVWEKPEGEENWVVDRASVDSAVNEAHRVYKVVGFFADVAQWESYIFQWGRAYGDTYEVKATEGRDPIGWDMRQSEQRVTRAHERLVQDVLDGTTHWSKVMDETLGRNFRRHVLNTYRHTNNHGLSFRKESRESKRKVDLYAAWMLAHEALNDYRLRAKKQPPPRTGKVWMGR